MNAANKRIPTEINTMNAKKEIIENCWNDRSLLEKDENKETVRSIIELLDKGELRVAEPSTHGWQVNEWVKKAVIMYFLFNPWKQLK